MHDLRGKAVADALTERLKKDISALGEKGVVPKLAVVRIGNREDDISYERGILKKFDAVGAKAEVHELPENCSYDQLEKLVSGLNNDNDVHGMLLFRPFPDKSFEDKIKLVIRPKKDTDGMSPINNAHIYAGDKSGYPPCTPQGVIELLDFYGIDVVGKNVTVVGRSLVVGKPLAMLLIAKNATVTVCHTKTADLASECKKADILIACAGVAKMIKKDFVHKDQIVIDVGVNVGEDGKLCGDVDYAEVAEHVKAITPVPGGTGTVTTCVLLKHVVNSAMNERLN